MDCSRKEDSDQSELRYSQIVISEEVDEVSPPPPDLTSNFRTLQEWLFNACDKDKPKTAIATYDFGFFESPGEYIVFVVGLNTYEKNENHSITTINFEPSDMDFQLPKSEHENLDREQVLDKVKAQLKDFIKTEKFKTSFFAQAKSIKTSFDGDEIWSK